MSESRVSSIAELEDRIRLYLTAAGISFDRPEGAAAAVTIGSSDVSLFAVQLDAATFLMRFVALPSRGADPSAELYEDVSRANSENVFGRLSVANSAEIADKADVWLDYVVNADDFDPSGFLKTLNVFAQEAGHFEAELSAR